LLTLASHGQRADEVEVSEGSVRLAGGNTDAGRVEVFYKGRWGWLCLQGPSVAGWGKVEADIVCKQLGLRKGVSTMRMGGGTHEDVLPIASIGCSGQETSITDCALQLRSTPDEACSGDLPAAGVRCTNFLPEDQPGIELLGAAPDRLLGNSSFRIECASEPKQAAKAETLPSFACNIEELSEESAACSADCATEGGAKDLPDPFVQSALEAFVFKPAMKEHLKLAQDQHHSAVLGEPVAAHSSTNSTAIGLEIGPKEQSLQTLRRAFFSPVARLLFDLDAEVIGLRGRKSGLDISDSLSSPAAAIFSELEEKGAVELGHMGLSEDLQQEALAALGDKAFDDRLAAVRSPLPLLEKWLQENSTISSAVAAYFGGHAVLHGYKVVHLPSTVTTEAFIAAHWHHDRAGRRLKMFILLNDVDPEEGHPTQVALGSHRLSYYWHEEFEQSRYDNDYVQREFKTLRLAGRRGTGYIFDTNSIHKGTPEGSQGRNVIVVEYHQAAKCGLISRLGLNIPCPSGDQKALNWYFTMD